jgi:hypothetical protein
LSYYQPPPPPPMLPYFDYETYITELHRMGWKDYKIEMACGFAVGMIAQLRRRNFRDMLGQNAIRLYGLYADQLAAEYVRAQSLSNTT